MIVFSGGRLLRRRERRLVGGVETACHVIAVLAVMVLAAACRSSAPTAAAPVSDVRALVGARARLVWVHGDGTDPFAAGRDLVLMGLDTDDGRGERVVLGARGSYMKPLLASDGTRVVFSRRPAPEAEPEVLSVAWDGSNLRTLASGFALAVWRDPRDGGEWVYVGLDPHREVYRTVRRFRLDDPTASELVWNRTSVSADSFQLSEDGRLAGGLFPWPEAGVAVLPNGSWRKLGEGCWTALTDVGRPLFWFFDGAHRNLSLVDVDRDARWTVDITSAPGFTNAEAYHPRWTNHPRFLVTTGPYNQGGTNQVRSGGAQAEVWLGRFSADYTRVEAWARATHNHGGDAYPDAWLAGAEGARREPAAAVLGPPPEARAESQRRAAEGAGQRLVVSARLVTAGPVPSPRAIAPYRNALVVNVYEIISVSEGAYAERRLLVAQWAIRDGRVVPAARRTLGTTSRLIVEPFDAHPELEGERLILDAAIPGLRLFYEVESP